MVPMAAAMPQQFYSTAQMVPAPMMAMPQIPAAAQMMPPQMAFAQMQMAQPGVGMWNNP